MPLAVAAVFPATLGAVSAMTRADARTVLGYYGIGLGAGATANAARWRLASFFVLA